MAPFAAGVGNALLDDGYSRLQARELVRLAAEVSGWLKAGGRDVDDLSATAVEEFFASRDRSRERFRTPHSLAPVMAWLRTVGAVAPTQRVTVGRTGAEVDLLDAHWHWCVTQRGISALTADQYRRRVAAFLELWRPNAPGEIGDLDGRAVLGTITTAAGVMTAPSLRCTVTALRSFLRFLHATGRTRCSLVTAVPPLKATSCWQHAGQLTVRTIPTAVESARPSWLRRAGIPRSERDHRQFTRSASIISMSQSTKVILSSTAPSV